MLAYIPYMDPKGNYIYIYKYMYYKYIIVYTYIMDNL